MFRVGTDLGTIGGSCNIFTRFTLCCVGMIAVFGFKFVGNIVAKSSRVYMVSSPSCKVGDNGVGFLIVWIKCWADFVAIFRDEVEGSYT